MAMGAPAHAACPPGRESLAKVELYFGAPEPASAWRRFLANIVTPRFPNGLTVLDGYGQWRGANGTAHEATRVLVIFYRPDATSDARIETIRRLYKRRFRQLSVLRADTSACVAF